MVQAQWESGVVLLLNVHVCSMYYCNWLCHMIMSHTAVDCGTPLSITNGSPGIPTITTFTGTVTYSCNDGYVLFGIATSTCQANATWSRPPECRGACAHSVFNILIIIHITCTVPYTNTGITIAGVPILIGGSVTITCTTDSPADSIILLQDDQLLLGTVMQPTILTYTIPLVNDSIHGNTFRCEGLLIGRTNSSNIAFDMVTVSLEGKSIIVYLFLFNTTPQLPNNLSMLVLAHLALHFH